MPVVHLRNLKETTQFLQAVSYRVGKWGHEGQKELSVYSAFIVGSYHRITWPGSNIWECDDTLEKIAASGDFWRIYFR